MPALLTPDDIIYDFAVSSDPAVSPDGTSLLYTRSQPDRTKKRPSSEIWTCSIDGSDGRQLTDPTERCSNARWSPDGQYFAYVVNAESGATLYMQELGAGNRRELVFHRSGIGALAWSHDGRTIAYNASFDPDNPNDSLPGNEDVPPVRVVNRIDYKQDNRGYLNDVRQQVWLVDAVDSARRMLTTDTVDHMSPQWSPDGSTIAVHIPNRNGMHGQLALLDVASGRETLVGDRDGAVGCWSWSPDSSRLLLAADTSLSWQFDLFLYHVTSGELERLTDDLQCQPDSGFPTVSSPSQPVWIDDTQAVFHAFHAGKSGLYQVDTSDGSVSFIHEWKALHSGLSADRAGQFFSQSANSMKAFGQVVVFDRETNRATVVVDPNANKTAPYTWERFDVRRGDFVIEAWLLKPEGFDESKQYPFVLDIHGGPNSWYGYAPSPMDRALVGAGFVVAYSNPRGSGSYGRAFTQAVTRDWGGEDYLDLMAVADAVVARPYVDPDRIGVYGYSYGGFMSSWIVGHTDRFKAAVIGAPVVDLVSFYGTADIGHTFSTLHLGARPHEDVEEYRFRSPITYLHDAKTPVLILHGENDDRVPISQGEQMFATLSESGCEVEFVRYPGGTHASVTRTGYPAHRFDYLDRLVGWFERWLV
ncbi:S9 family peptidase [soil metagenome]